MKRIALLLLFVLGSTGAFAGSSITINKLDKSSITASDLDGKSQFKKETGFSGVMEGAVSDPTMEVYVMVHQPRTGRWRLFPASVDDRAQSDGTYRWRAICLFGEKDGPGVGDNHQVHAIALDRGTLDSGTFDRIPAKALKTPTITIKRVR